MKKKKQEVLYINQRGDVLSPVNETIVAVTGRDFSWEELIRHISKIHVKGNTRYVCVPIPEKSTHIVIPPVFLGGIGEKFSMLGKGVLISRSEDKIKIMSYKQAEKGKGECLCEIQL
ncbi:hypothetical protein KKA24_00890 [Patescibacteria group bacterium]|nr:hypothetical protein [Patescibacteria group bacterium]